MKKIGFIYFDNLYQEEEKVVSSKFITCRTSSLSELPDKTRNIFSCDLILPRSSKLSQAEYEKSFYFLKNNGLNLVSTPEVY